LYASTIKDKHEKCSCFIPVSLGSAHEITITLWGEAAEQFDEQAIYSLGQENTVVAVFVGTTVRVYNGTSVFFDLTLHIFPTKFPLSNILIWTGFL
jgi:hypothetical protein